MSAVDLARWQFAITTVYHFLFVPITIGLSAIVAWFQTQHVRRHREEDLRLAKFFGKLFVINFALGLVTGIVQEFQFGMNWSDYSRFVGDVFGAPLALEALLAFFLESTFLGLWIFGWGRIPEKLHAASIWLVHIGTLAVGVLHPRRELVHAEPGRLPLRPGHRPRRDDRLRRRPHQQGAARRPSRTPCSRRTSSVAPSSWAWPSTGSCAAASAPSRTGRTPGCTAAPPASVPSSPSSPARSSPSAATSRARS